MASKLSKKDIDLLSAYKQKKETPKYTGALKYAALPSGMLIVVLALFIYFTLSNHKLENETEDLKQQTTKIQEQIANDPNLERYNSLQTVKRDIAAYKKFKKDIQSYPELSQDTFDKILLASDVDITVTSFNYTRESQIVTLQIEGTNVNSTEQFVRRLKNTDLFAMVNYSGYVQNEKILANNDTVSKKQDATDNKQTNKNVSDAQALMELLENLNKTQQQETIKQQPETQKVYTATILCTLK